MEDMAETKTLHIVAKDNYFKSVFIAFDFNSDVIDLIDEYVS